MALFDERLRAAMKEKHVTQAMLCKGTEIPKSAMSQYMSGKFLPRQNRVSRIAEVLGVDTAWLMGIESANQLSPRECEILCAYRNDEPFRNSVDMLLDGRTVFRAAKSDDGRIAPATEKRGAAELEKIAKAPETDQDF